MENCKRIRLETVPRKNCRVAGSFHLDFPKYKLLADKSCSVTSEFHTRHFPQKKLHLRKEMAKSKHNRSQIVTGSIL